MCLYSAHYLKNDHGYKCKISGCNTGPISHIDWLSLVYTVNKNDDTEEVSRNATMSL